MGREGVEKAKNGQEKYATDSFSNCQEPAQFVNSKSDYRVFYSFFLFPLSLQSYLSTKLGDVDPKIYFNPSEFRDLFQFIHMYFSL